ncbi:hypothetical protein [Devosia sp. A449]
MRRALLALVFCISVPAIGLAEDEPLIPDDAVEVEVQDDITVHFWQTDIINPTAMIADMVGVSSQFRDGESILGQVFFKTPIPLTELEAMTSAKNSSSMSFRCDRGGLYQIEGHDVIAGVNCVLVTDAQIPANRQK